jgi:hypothetical protein
MLVFVLAFSYVIASFFTALLANSWIMDINYIGTWELARSARQTVQIIKCISTIASILVGTILAFILCCMGSRVTDSQQEKLCKAKEDGTLAGCIAGNKIIVGGSGGSGGSSGAAGAGG